MARGLSLSALNHVRFSIETVQCELIAKIEIVGEQLLEQVPEHLRQRRSADPPPQPSDPWGLHVANARLSI